MANGSGRIGRARDVLRDVSIGHSVTFVQKLGKVAARLLFMLSRSAKKILAGKSTKPLFRFRGCLFSKQDARSLSTAVQHHIPATVDDRALISLFDNPKSIFGASPLAPTGLFGHPSLTHPSSLISLSNASLVRAQLLTERILRARDSREELLKVVKNLDRLSDILCGVIDLAELVRNAHPERVWVDAANRAYESLCEFMNVLNTNVGLYEVCNYKLSL